jgi:hypothetical protein
MTIAAGPAASADALFDDPRARSSRRERNAKIVAIDRARTAVEFAAISTASRHSLCVKLRPAWLTTGKRRILSRHRIVKTCPANDRPKTTSSRPVAGESPAA